MAKHLTANKSLRILRCGSSAAAVAFGACLTLSAVVHADELDAGGNSTEEVDNSALASMVSHLLDQASTAAPVAPKLISSGRQVIERAPSSHTEKSEHFSTDIALPHDFLHQSEIVGPIVDWLAVTRQSLAESNFTAEIGPGGDSLTLKIPPAEELPDGDYNLFLFVAGDSADEPEQIVVHYRLKSSVVIP